MRATLLCLHGWGGSSSSFNTLRTKLQDADVEFLAPDLPGFGTEPEPDEPWNVDSYGTWVVGWLKKNRQSKGPLLLLGHSHGGRIALKLVASGTLTPDHLYLCAPAINRHHRYRLRRKVGQTLAKTGKAVLSLPVLSAFAPLGKTALYKLMRVHDYEKASPIMQKTLVLVTQEDISLLADRISVPTDLFWGNEDSQTPVEDGEFLASAIKPCRLHRYAGVRHAVHCDRAAEIAAVIRHAIA